MKKDFQVVYFDLDSFKEDDLSIDCNTTYEHVLLVPKSPVFSTIDFLMLPNKFFQVTKGKSHPIAATKCFIQLIKAVFDFCKLRNIEIPKDEHNNEMIDFFFVVPEQLYKNYGPQSIKCSEETNYEFEDGDKLQAVYNNNRKTILELERCLIHDKNLREAVNNFW